MKILHTAEWYPPSVGGVQLFMQQISERLAARGHDVTVATARLPGRTGSAGGVRIEEFEVTGSVVSGIKGELERYQRFLLDGDFDVMFNYSAQQWTADLAFPLLGRLRARTVFGPCGFAGLGDPAARGYFERMPSVLDRYDRIVLHTVNFRDARFVRERSRARTALITYGADPAEFPDAPASGLRERLGLPAGIPLLVTVGNHTGGKGHGRVMAAFLRARIGRAALLVVGGPAPWPGCEARCQRLARAVRVASLGRKRALVLDLPRRDVVAALREADVFVFASRSECSPIVLVEAAAAGTPFITGTAGNAEELAEWTGAGVVVPGGERPDGTTETDIGALARAIERLVADPLERERLGEAGRAAFLDRFTWERVTDRYEELYRDLLAAPARATDPAA